VAFFCSGELVWKSIAERGVHNSVGGFSLQWMVPSCCDNAIDPGKLESPVRVCSVTMNANGNCPPEKLIFLFLAKLNTETMRSFTGLYFRWDQSVNSLIDWGFSASFIQV
jgi:hypothetical protein